jgi:hypothetical protein
VAALSAGGRYWGADDSSTTEADTRILVPVTTTFTTFYCAVSADPGTGTTTFTVRLNGVSQAGTCAIGAGTSASATVSIAVTAGDLVTVLVTDSNSVSSVTPYWGLAP